MVNQLHLLGFFLAPRLCRLATGSSSGFIRQADRRRQTNASTNNLLLYILIGYAYPVIRVHAWSRRTVSNGDIMDHVHVVVAVYTKGKN